MKNLMGVIWVGFLALAVQAQEPVKKLWTNQAEFGGVFTDGNSESSLLSLKNAYTWKNDVSELRFNVAAVRAENARFTRVYVQQGSDLVLIEDKENKVSADNYQFNTVYTRKIGKSLSWFAGLDWTSDKIAGLESRLGLSAGLSKSWIETEAHSLSTSAGAKLVQESNVYEPEGFDSSYPALALNLNHKLKTTATSEYVQALKMDMNTDETRDYRADWAHGFSVSVSTRIALKLGVQFQFDNVPAVEAVPLQDNTIVFAVPFEKLDTIFTTSIVINL